MTKRRNSLCLRPALHCEHLYSPCPIARVAGCMDDALARAFVVDESDYVGSSADNGEYSNPPQMHGVRSN